MKVWRVNVCDRSLKIEDVPADWERLGGRGLLSKILVDEVEATCYPLGKKNKLIFAPGLLVGHKLSSCDRISIGTKSPLTGGIKEANAGGSTGLHIARLGIKVAIIEDSPADENWWIVYASKDGIRFDSAEELIGKGAYESAEILQEQYGRDVAVSMIGPGGEMQFASAGILNLDKDGVPSRIAARGGVGAVMGSKHIKAIVWDSSDCEDPPLIDPGLYKETRKKYTRALVTQERIVCYRDYSTASMTLITNAKGSLPTKNFSQGDWEGAATLSGEHMRSTILKRGGDGAPTHACMVGCVIRCSNVYADADGKEIVSPLEYETIGLMGSNLGIANLDDVARMNYEANDLGIDTIELGASLGVAAEAGLAEFGDTDSMMALISEIRRATPLGRVLGMGATITGKVFGVERVPAVKGQAMSAYEPRAIKGTGVTFATSPQGADHTSGLTIRANVDHLDPTIQKELSRSAQISMAGFDTLGACIFSGPGFSAEPDTAQLLLKARYGWEVEQNIIDQLGRESLTNEREFNRRAGFTAADDRLPEWMTEEPLPPLNSVFDVSEKDLDQVFDWK